LEDKNLSFEVRDEDEREQEFEDDGSGHSEPEPFGVPVYTSILIGCIVAVTATQLSTGLEESVAAAGFVKPAFKQGEYWRILTGAALHGGLLHIFFNSYAFYNFGRLFEVLSNRAHLAVIFLLAAVGGGILSLIFMPDGRSVGASGGILGIVSYLAVYAFKRRQFISSEFRKSLLLNIGFILLFGLILYQVIDNYGHIGGLIVGAVYGAVQIPSDPHIDPRVAGKPAEAAGLAALGIFIAVSAFSIYLILANLS
jgi:membrane associated rhomboid family serine protease